jgi:hypothetical protein
MRSPDDDGIVTSIREGRGLKFEVAADVQVQPKRWLIDELLPCPKLFEVSGLPGSSKTTLASYISAILTREPREVFDGHLARGPMNVAIASVEDDPGDTLRPRVEAHGGDLSRVFFPEPFSLPKEIDALVEFVRENSIRLLWLDPAEAYLQGDLHTNHESRRTLACLQHVHDAGCSIGFIRHLRKASNGPAMYRSTGSVGLVAATRAAFILAEDPDDEQCRVLATSKFNLGRPPQSLRFRVEEVADQPTLRFDGTSSLRADSLAQDPDPEQASALEEACQFLETALQDGPRLVRDVLREAREIGVSERTLKRARSRLGVQTDKRGRSSGKDGEGQPAWRIFL